MMDEQWIIDASIPVRGGAFCFCPVVGDIKGALKIVWGINFISSEPPGNLVGIFHLNGEDAVEKFCWQHREELEQMGFEFDAPALEGE